MDSLLASPLVLLAGLLLALYVGWRVLSPQLRLPSAPFSLDGLAGKLLGPSYEIRKLERRAAREVKAGNALLAGRMLEEAGLPQRALDVYLQAEEWMAAAFALEKVPGRAEKAAEMFLKAGDYKKAADVYAAAGKPARAATLFEERGNNLEAARLYGAAHQWDKAAALFTKSGYALRAAEAYEKMGDWRLAAEAYERHFMENVTFSTTYSGPPPAAETRNALRSGKLYEQAGAPERAREIYLRGSFFAEAARVSLALSQFPRAAELFLRAEDLAAAADACERGGDTVKAAGYRGEIALKAGRMAEAAALFQQGLDHQRAAELFEQVGLLERAALAYEAAESHANAANVWLRGGRKDRAAACFDRAGEYETAAKLYEEAGDGAKAAQLFERAGLTYQSGLAAAEAGELSKAISLLQRVAPQDERYRDASERLAGLFLEAGKPGLAIERLQKVLAGAPVGPDTLSLHYALALAREAAGDSAEALALYKAIQAESFDYRDAGARAGALEAGRALPIATPAPPVGKTPAPAARPPQAPPARPPQAAGGVGAAPAAASASAGAPSLSARFVLNEEIARGPLGAIHRGEDSADGNKAVALRLLAPAAVPHLKAAIADLKAAAALQHPNLVRLIGVVELSGRHAIVTELVQGASLGANLAAGRRLGLSQVQALARTLARLLVAIHDRGLAHGSIQPSNLMSAAGTLKLADLGLGRIHLALAPAHPYRAPEGLLDPAADVYSFGAVLHHLLTGHPPEAPSAAAPPGSLDELAARCRAARPEQRPRAQEIARALGVEP